VELVGVVLAVLAKVATIGAGAGALAVGGSPVAAALPVSARPWRSTAALMLDRVRRRRGA
jgi:hypothetical protein